MSTRRVNVVGWDSDVGLHASRYVDGQTRYALLQGRDVQGQYEQARTRRNVVVVVVVPPPAVPLFSDHPLSTAHPLSAAAAADSLSTAA